MPPIELGPTRPISAIDARITRQAGEPSARPQRSGAPAATAQLSDALDPGAPPVDSERVQMIRKAVEQGTYPIVPARIADAIIAAGLLLRKGGS